MTNKPPKVSVVIPCHNYAHFLPETLESVLNQTIPAFEVLVVDDSSSDNTPEIIASYGKRISSIRVEGRGAYGARNDSLPHLSGDYFLNVDADNRIAPDFIEQTLNALTKAPPDIGYIYTQRQYFGDRQGLSSLENFSEENILIHKMVDMGALIRMPLVKKYGFDERFNDGCGDQAFFIKLYEQGFRGQLLDAALLYYRVHGNSITGAVRKEYKQCRIQQRLIESFPTLFSEELAKQAMDDARNRTLVSIIHNRSADANFSRRLQDFKAFTRTNVRHAEWLRQLKYLVYPKAVLQKD
ncbi:glycosyltransferase family A protein [Kiritimatiellota bacterium B12222]|nr:glycosyltransferase family A protein [Kiritimatiellota bacterium B12222]